MMMMWELQKRRDDEIRKLFERDGGDTNTQQGAPQHLHKDGASNGMKEINMKYYREKYKHKCKCLHLHTAGNSKLGINMK